MERQPYILLLGLIISGLSLFLELIGAFFAFYISIRLTFFMHFIVDSDKTIFESLKLSYRLTKGRAIETALNKFLWITLIFIAFLLGGTFLFLI